MSAALPARSTWRRPSLQVQGPKRGFANLARSDEGARAGLGGVPLSTVEDGVIAAVRLAYGVADQQLTRSASLAQRLHDAGDRAVGEQSGRKALDASEQLVLRAVLGALSWLEAVSPSADADSPIKRLLSADFRLLGSLLGLRLEPATKRPEPPSAAPPAAAPMHGAGAPGMPVFLRGPSKRPVVVQRFQSESISPGTVPLLFYHAQKIGEEPIDAMLAAEHPHRVELHVTVRRDARGGVWKAAICLEDRQIGLVEIEL